MKSRKALIDMGFIEFKKWKTKDGRTMTSKQFKEDVIKGIELEVKPICEQIEKNMQEALSNTKTRIKIIPERIMPSKELQTCFNCDFLSDTFYSGRKYCQKTGRKFYVEECKPFPEDCPLEDK